MRRGGRNITEVDLPGIFEALEAHYGTQRPEWPLDPYLFLVWWHCGYPASDAACARGWKALSEKIGVRIEDLHAASLKELTAALKAGGMVPDLRAQRLKQIVELIQQQFGGDLKGGLSAMPVARARAALKKFPNIADPGADRILLFAGLDPVAAAPSNCPHVLVRIRKGFERDNYGVTYREAQEMIESATPRSCEARQRAYLLLKRHGQEICKRTNPKCAICPMQSYCAYASGKMRGGSQRTPR